MKKSFIFFSLALCLTVSFTACGNEEKEKPSSQISVNTMEESIVDIAVSELAESEIPPAENTDISEKNESTSDILVAYFTYAENADISDSIDASASASIQLWNGKMTGNTGVIADMIAQKTGGELFSIQTVKTYPFDYNGTLKEGQAEKSNNEYPELSTHIENLDGYNTIFVGFPNWWYGMPMAMYSFFDEYDFSGKTIIPFCTSGGSGFSDALEVIAEYEPNSTILDGLSVSGSGAVNSESDVENWLNSLKL